MAKDVEIIILPLNEEVKNEAEKRKKSFLKFIDQFHFKLPEDYKFNREALHEG
jgi:hypothetical protein